MFNKQTNIFLFSTDYFFKCEMWKRSWQWYVFVHFIWANELWFGSWWDLMSLGSLRTHSPPLSHCETQVYVQDVFVCVAYCRQGQTEWHAEVTEPCGGHTCSACVRPWSRFCRSTCTSRQCWRSERSDTGCRGLLVLHTHRCLKETNTSTY